MLEWGKLFQLIRVNMRRENKYNIHHWLPKSRWWDNNDLNCEMIKVTTHDAIHTLFSNMIFPEQIESLTSRSSRVLLPEIQRELQEWLDIRDIHDPTQRYKEWCILMPKKHKWINLDTE